MVFCLVFYIFPQLLWVFSIYNFLHVYSCIQYFVFWTSKNCQKDVIGPPALAGRVLWNWVCQFFPPSVRPSILPSFCLSGRFLGIVSSKSSKLFLLNFGVMLETQMKLCVTEPYFREKFFLRQKLRKWAKNGPKTYTLKKFATNFYWNCPIVKIYSICCVPAQIPYLGKF